MNKYVELIAKICIGGLAAKGLISTVKDTKTAIKNRKNNKTTKKSKSKKAQ